MYATRRAHTRSFAEAHTSALGEGLAGTSKAASEKEKPKRYVATVMGERHSAATSSNGRGRVSVHHVKPCQRYDVLCEEEEVCQSAVLLHGKRRHLRRGEAA